MKKAPSLHFSHLLGQEKAKKLLGRTLATGRVAHGYLFKGPDGVGKQLFARSMAAIINCKNSGEGACDHCPSCKKFKSGNHPDFLLVQPENGAIKIDRIRELKKALSYPPYESKMRIVLLEDIHTMRSEAANSMLKILEEPPVNNLLILTAQSTKSILPTISSRCQVIPFFSLSLEDTKKILMEKEGVDEKTAGLLSRMSEGSPGGAILLKKTDMLDTWERVEELLGQPVIDEDIGKLLRTAEIMAKLKENLLPLLGLLRLWIRDKLVSCQPVESKEDNMYHRDEGCSGSKLGSGDLFAKLDAVNRAEKELAHNCNRTLVCEILLFRLQ